MKIQIGANQKMKLYNTYRLCKQYIEFFEKDNLSKQIFNNNNVIYKTDNWFEFKDKLKTIRKIPVLMDFVDSYFNEIPVFVCDKNIFELPASTANSLNSIKFHICNRMETIIDLYEGMNIGNGGNGIDIKIPPCDDLKDYISYLKDIDFIFTQCPFLQCANEILKFESVDVGSNWIKFIVASASTCLILNNVASLVDKALILKSHYISIQQQEEDLKSIQIKNELTKEQVETFNLLRSAYMNTAVTSLEDHFGKLDNPEERDKAERALEKLELLLEKGCEIYATLDSPEETQALFPEIQGNLELPDNIMKYLDTKE